MDSSEHKIDRQVSFAGSELTISAIAMEHGVHLDIVGEPQAYWYPVLCTIIYYAFEPVKLLGTAIRRGHLEFDNQIGFAYHGVASIDIPAGHVACQVQGKRTDIPSNVFDRVVIESMQSLIDGADKFDLPLADRPQIDRLLGEDAASDLAAALAAGEEAYAAGDMQGAAEIYASILEESREEPGALAGLARCYLKTGDVARAEQTLGLVPPDKRKNPAVAAVQAAINLAHKAAEAGDTAQLEAKVAANPADHQARIDLATALAAGGKKAAAVDHLLESFKLDRNWNDQAARKQLVQLFEAWGPKDAATLDGRRRLSSLLFS